MQRTCSERACYPDRTAVEYQVSNFAFNSRVAAGDQADVCGVAEIMLRCSTAPSSQQSREILWTVASRVARRSTMRSQ